MDGARFIISALDLAHTSLVNGTHDKSSRESVRIFIERQTIDTNQKKKKKKKKKKKEEEEEKVVVVVEVETR